MSTIDNSFWMMQGRCWRLGDDVSVDTELTLKELTLQRETRLEVLKEHVLTKRRPEFTREVKANDILVAGKRFAQGNPHIQGLLGLAGLQVGVVVESIPRGSLRNSVNAGLKILPACPDVCKWCVDGDELAVDFRHGVVTNLTRSRSEVFEPLEEKLLDIIAMGGWKAAFRLRLAQMRESGVLP